MKNDMKEIQFSLGNNSKVAEAKLREEAQNVYRNVDVKIDRNKKDIQNLLAEFKNSIALSIKRNEDQQSVVKPQPDGFKSDNIDSPERTTHDKNAFRVISTTFLVAQKTMIYKTTRLMDSVKQCRNSMTQT